MSQDGKEGRAGNKKKTLLGYGIAIGVTALVTVVVLALLMNIFERRREGLTTYHPLVEVTEETTDPAVWGKNWPRQYDSYKRTVDYEVTRYGGNDAVPRQKLDMYPWLKMMWSGYAFSLDYRESRGHAYMLLDQDQTERVKQREQPGACLHCHAAIIPAYREVGAGDVMEGFRKVSSMSLSEARHMVGQDGQPLIEHPVSCGDCHDPESMELRVTRPAFLNGIAALKKHETGKDGYNPNRDATRQEMRTYVCAQCHVEYHFAAPDNVVTYPWSKGLKIENAEAYYDEIGFSDWKHGFTGANMLKAQHPEFELYSQGTHAAAGVSCADCHMPYVREGALKVSNHHVRSPLLDVSKSCQTCHNIAESELLRRVSTIQDRTHELINRSSEALVDMMNEIVAAREAGATEEQLAQALDMHRKASWRVDYVFSEGSHGFHAPQESARILAESIDFARRGQLAAQALRAEPAEPLQTVPAPVEGVTPTDKAPPGQ